MRLRNIVYKSQNLILQQVQSSESTTCIIMGSGYSLSLDSENKVIHKDPLFFPPSGKDYGDYNVLSLFYPFECKGLSQAALELAGYINSSMKNYTRIVLHGHSKCGSCFVKAAKFLERQVSIVSVSAPLNCNGTPITSSDFDLKLSSFEKPIFHAIFSDHNVDKDLRTGSEFLQNLDLNHLSRHNYIIIVSECKKFSIIPIDAYLNWFNTAKGIYGDGIIPKASQIPSHKRFVRILATHASSMKASMPFVKSIL